MTVSILILNRPSPIVRHISEGAMRHRSYSVILTVAAFASLAGCSSSQRLTPVQGKLYIGDQPAQGGTGFVTFHPDASKGNKWMEESVGEIKEDGTYVLNARGAAGAAPGWYKVAVNYSEVLNPANPYVTKWLMPQPEKYGDWNKSGISVEVVEKPQPGQYDIKLPAMAGST